MLFNLSIYVYVTFFVFFMRKQTKPSKKSKTHNAKLNTIHKNKTRRIVNVKDKRDKRDKKDKSIKTMKTMKNIKSIKSIKSSFHKNNKNKRKTFKTLKKGGQKGYDRNQNGKTFFDNNTYVRESHNCYSYFLNLINPEAIKLCQKDFKGDKTICKRSQPGYASGHTKLKESDYNCDEITKRVLDDNKSIKRINSINDTCGSDYYKGALVVAPQRDYHFYREDEKSKKWTHKPGFLKVTDLDSDGKLIIDPQKASRDYGGTLNYTDFCSFLCVPKEKGKKTMSHKPQY